MDSSEVTVLVATVLGVGVVAQWLGWRLRVPAIVFLLSAGLLVGPATGWLDPDAVLGDALFPLTSLAVAVILFEGSFRLGAAGVRAAGRTVWLLLTVGAAVTVVATAAAAHLVLGVGWPLAWVTSGVLVVTGPTVIGPLVRSLGLRGRVAAVLEAEGTLIDPLGAILTVLLFQAFFLPHPGGPLAVELLATLAVGAAVGAVTAWACTLVLARFLVPDELHNVMTLAAVVLAFVVADLLRPEAGLVATTAMGLVLAGQRRVEVPDVLEFNETLRTLFIAGLFVLLGARITPATLTGVEWRNVAFLAVLVLLVRPAAVAVATWGSPLSRSERCFVAVTAPRGIVAAAVASVFSIRLAEQDTAGAQVLLSATFTVIAGTVLLSGLGARPLARRLGLLGGTPPVVILGGNVLGRQLGEVLEQAGTPVRVVSLDRDEVTSLRLSGVAAVRGSVLDEGLWAEVTASGASAFVAASASDEVNELACRRMASLIGRRHVFRLAPARREHAGLAAAAGPAGRRLASHDATLQELVRLLDDGWRVRATPLTAAFGEDAYRARHPDAVVLGVLRPDGLHLAAAGQGPRLRPGDTVLAVTP